MLGSLALLASGSACIATRAATASDPTSLGLKFVKTAGGASHTRLTVFPLLLSLWGSLFCGLSASPSLLLFPRAFLGPMSAIAAVTDPAFEF